MNRISVVMDAMPTNVSLYCTASKRKLQWHTMSADPPDIMFVEFFHDYYLSAMDKYIMVIPARPHWVQKNNNKKRLMRN